MSSSRAGLRFLHSSRLIRDSLKRNIGRRFATVDATATTAPPTAAQQNAFQRLWNSPIGMKTVHFWAPVMKWSIVLAGVSDFTRPAKSLSLTQNIALTCTGAIWTRWCYIIKPRNLFLAAVNFFLCCTGVTQVTRIYLYQKSIEGLSAEEIAEKDAREAKETVKGIAKDPEGAVDRAVNVN